MRSLTGEEDTADAVAVGEPVPRPETPLLEGRTCVLVATTVSGRPLARPAT